MRSAEAKCLLEVHCASVEATDDVHVPVCLEIQLPPLALHVRGEAREVPTVVLVLVLVVVLVLLVAVLA
jgi:hypothetical protein